MTRFFLQFIIRCLFRLLTRVEIIGLDNVPKKGGYILAINHMSRLDAPLVFVNFPRQDMTGLAADKYKRHPFFRWIINRANGIWLNREEADPHALKQALHHLRNGGVLGIAPEGTRSQVGMLIAAKTGVAYLADKSGVPVIPAALYGTEDALPKVFRLQRPPIRMEYGKPFHLPAVDRRNRDQDLKQNTDEIMCQIAAMLPGKYHGHYNDHPRLQELLSQKISG